MELDNEELEKHLFQMTIDDRTKADEAYALFFDHIKNRTDGSSAVKEGLTKALELKILAAKNIIELRKIKQEKETSSNILLNVLTPKKAGIDLNKIKEELEDDN